MRRIARVSRPRVFESWRVVGCSRDCPSGIRVSVPPSCSPRGLGHVTHSNGHVISCVIQLVWTASCSVLRVFFLRCRLMKG